MKFCKDTKPGAYAVQVMCTVCGKRFTLAEGWADTDGRPFVDYWCHDCAVSRPEVPRFIDGNELMLD